MNGLRRHWFFALLIGLAAVGVWRLRFDVEVLNLLPRDLPEVQGLALYNEYFANARELIVSVQTEEPAQAEAAAQAIAEHLREDTNRVAEAHWQPPWREHPEQAAAMLAHTWINQPPEDFRQLEERLTTNALLATLVSARQRLATTLSPQEFALLGYDPLGLTSLPGNEREGVQFGRGDEMFASMDGTFRLVFVQATSDLADYRACAAWFASIRAQVQEIAESTGALDGVTVRYTGRPAFVSEISSGMQSDMTRSVVGTGIIVAVLFLLIHRRLKPMAWLLVLMVIAIGLTLALGGLIYGPLNVVSVGFAAILLGLAADYGMVLYQEWREQLVKPHSHQVGSGRRGVRWSAITTASAFLMLNLSGLPGLSQLGTLVAIGVLVGAALMLRLYLTPFLSEGNIARQSPVPLQNRDSTKRNPFLKKAALVLTAVLLAGSVAALWNGVPAFNRSADSLRPQSSQAYAALDEVEQRMQRDDPSWWLILSAQDESEAGRMLTQSEAVLEAARADGSITRFTLPTKIWPKPEYSKANRQAMVQLLNRWPELQAVVLDNGFTSNALSLAQAVMEAFQLSLTSTNPWPDNAVSRWSLGQFTARTPTNLLVVGLVYPSTAHDAPLPPILPGQAEGKVWLVGWERLGNAMAELVRRDLSHVLIPTLLIIVVCLSFAFRRATEVVLSLAALAFSLVILSGAMKLLGWSWNLLNLMALPLLLGVGVDYSIHTILALRRYNGDLIRTRRSVGRALFLCAATTTAGFGSLSFSNNAGLASLGKVCATGVAVSYFVATVLLPGWWSVLQIRRKSALASNALDKTSSTSSPSALYGARGWRLGLSLARCVPYSMLVGAAKLGAVTYRKIARHRYDVVATNLRPLCGNDAFTEDATDRLFSQFARKLADLWVYESGRPIENLFGELNGFQHLLEAQAGGRGMLLVTPHLGNWEFGAPLLTRQGVRMQVVTLAEPDEPLTQLRIESRARWNIETVVIGADPFGFVELIRRLESGATVALLIDRPAATTATRVELFGRPFEASSAPAELARATGCSILPVYVVQEQGHYSATALAPVDYDRATLRDPAARHALTQKILRAFEPAIRQHADQWYHFVPIWPDTAATLDPAADI